jgi:hypothetical protein
VSAEPFYRPAEPPVMTIQRLRSSLAVLERHANALVTERDQFAEDLKSAYGFGAACGVAVGLMLGFVISGLWLGVW